ncbi:UdgX family uracil-DNA binding protein [Anaeromyxobacter terrae]|uniref:UdgX family uracil-DNA binding protein n=1 Tax=Anaeromyxobacter terrae TaxID=2925406 RepID=UPI00243708C9|nr:UdgX family uracil-DNA binding protein [Anaeromyxobacter sp. SG22]
MRPHRPSVDNHEGVPRRSDSRPRSQRAPSPARTVPEPRRPEQPTPAPIPGTRSLAALREAAQTCRACPLWELGTQTVFGEGPPHAAVMLVGEQPGNEEDLAGHPFIGPAGRLLDKALAAAGIDRGAVYVTNAVKHFKWEARGKRRIHQKPNAGEVRACRPWLDAELRAVEPRAVVLLGATAAQALLGSGFRVTQRRGEFLSTPFAPIVVATVHPSSILRAPDDETRRTVMKRFVEDLARVADALRTSPPSPPAGAP